MNGFTTSEILKNHQEVCLNPGDSTKLKNYE